MPILFTLWLQDMYILNAAEANGIDLPATCRGGICGRAPPRPAPLAPASARSQATPSKALG